MLLSASKLMGCDMWYLIRSLKFVIICLTKMTLKYTPRGRSKWIPIAQQKA